MFKGTFYILLKRLILQCDDHVLYYQYKIILLTLLAIHLLIGSEGQTCSIIANQLQSIADRVHFVLIK